jgi:hypothetical protein
MRKRKILPALAARLSVVLVAGLPASARRDGFRDLRA